MKKSRQKLKKNLEQKEMREASKKSNQGARKRVVLEKRVTVTTKLYTTKSVHQVQQDISSA